jgi:rapamycin-insensitive companion of mTOR
MKKTGPVAHSLFLDQILEDSGCFQGESFAGDRIHSPNWQQLVLGSSADEKSMSAISESKVLESKDATTWDWDVLASVFRYPPSHTLDGSGSSSELQTVRQFVKRVSDFFKPSNNLFAKVELKLKRARYLTKIGCLFCDFLVRSKSPEGTRFLDDFVIDITNEINLFLSSTSPPQDCLLSPTRIATTVCQYYFLFLGRLSRTPEGRAALDRQQVLHCLYELLAHRTDLYFKLVVASLDYSSPEWGSRNLLSKALKEGSEYTRLYATRFIGVLIRSRTQNIAQWGISLLVMQLSDKSSIIPWVSLDLLAEACDDKMNLEAVICAMKDADGGLDSLGLKGVFLRTQFLASGNGFKLLRQTGFLDDQLRRWRDEYNERYVTLVEEMLNDGFSHHQKNEERVYGRRSHEAHTVRNVYLPPHLYGQLASTEKGFKVNSK